MNAWYEDLNYEDFRGKYVRVAFEDGIIILGPATYNRYHMTVATNEAVKGVEVCTGYMMIAHAFDSVAGSTTEGTNIAILQRMDDKRWRPLQGIKSVDLVWDEREYEKIPVNQVKTGDWIVLEGRKYLVTQIVGSTIVASAGTYLEVDKSMITTVLRYRKGETHE